MADRIGQQLGNYRLLSLLGKGGFAEVYLGEHVYLGTQAAIKVLLMQLGRSDIEQFRSEAQTVAQLEHPHIVRVLDFGIEGTTPFLVMSYAPNGTLRIRHPKGSFLPLALVISYVQQMATALQYAHSHKLVHRDVKPENMLLGRNSELLLTDFGIAAAAHSTRSLNTQDTFVGTISYMAPEQIQGKPRTASDQYALGIVAYEWLSGTLPFIGTAMEVIGQHLSTVPSPLHEKTAGISPEVENIVLKALAKAPEDRFGCIQEFADALWEAMQIPQGTVTLSSTIEARMVAPPTPPEAVSQLLSIQKPGPWVPALASTEATQIGGVPPSIQYPKEVFHSSPQDPPRNAGRSSPQRHRLDVRLSLWMGGILGLILLLWGVLAITIGPIIPITGTRQNGASATPIHSDQVVQKWAFPTGGQVASSPAVANGVLYVSSGNDKIYAIDASTGLQKWIFSVGSIVASPTVIDGVLYVGSQDHRIYAIDASTGLQRWTFPTGDQIASSPTVVNGVLYIGSGDDKIYAIDASTGLQKWVFPTGGQVASSPMVVNGVLYVGSRDHKIYAIDASTGLQKWTFPTGDSVLSSPMVVNGVLYVGSWDHKIYAIDASTGLQKWAFPTGDSVLSSPMVVNGVLYVGSQDHKIYAIDASTGLQKWAFPTDDSVYSSPTVVNGVLYVGSEDRKIYAIDASTGLQKWAFPTGGIVYSSPTVVNGVLYVGSDDSSVYALTLPTS